MNIKEAKQQIKNAMIAYFSKDENGEYILPPERQRPVFLVGAPGIGKTAVMEQIAAEMGVGLLSYSMTHHTRQSALGLPYIVKKNYMGTEYEVSEYTMSEIISSVYELMENTGIREGILFLDEINCVSETLSPVMLQFLQYKVFGRHCVPNGWIVVTAGNPPEYNNSVREFDIATLDRLKCLEVEPDYTAWKEYAVNAGIHPAVLTYLEIKNGDFYRVETTVDGKRFVTARGWEDLSRMIRVYEDNGLSVDAALICQYLRHPAVAREFAQYYDLFRKYRSDYRIAEILDGSAGENILERARAARFDERLSLIALLMEAIRNTLSGVVNEGKLLTELMKILKDIRIRAKGNTSSAVDIAIGAIEARIKAGKEASSVSAEELSLQRSLCRVLRAQSQLISPSMSEAEAFACLKKDFEERVGTYKRHAETGGVQLTNMFAFAEQAFGEGHEMLALVTELTADTACASFIARFGCEAYFRHNRELLIYDRAKELNAFAQEIGLSAMQL